MSAMSDIPLDATHDAAARSWVESANAAGCEFPVQNLPYGRFRRAGHDEAWRIGVAIGDQILDLARAAARGRWDTPLRVSLDALAHGDLNRFMARPAAERRALRAALFGALRAGSAQQAALAGCLLAQRDAELGLPCAIGDYTDFYTSIHHATAVGRMFRPDNPLLPNYKWVPIGYHGRASSLVASGTALHRPSGQLKGPDDAAPRFAPSRRVDYELELGALVAGGNELGTPVPIAAAEDHLFGLTLLNDWSARDLQGWEYQPLGPFLAKNFGSTVSPWVVTLDALAPYRCAFERSAADPQPLPYLDSAANRAHGAFDLQVEVWLQTARMRAAGEAAVRLSASNYRDAYWTLAQLLTHHTSNGCNLQPGDLLGTGTLSGPTPAEAGSLLELGEGGKKPIKLPNGETRAFVEDGDAVILRAYAQRGDGPRIGFGDCAGVLLAAR